MDFRTLGATNLLESPRALLDICMKPMDRGGILLKDWVVYNSLTIATFVNIVSEWNNAET
jgi:hypothetical protein